MASAGDVNGDGFADLVVGAWLGFGAGQAYVYLGGAGGLSSTPSTTLDARDGPSDFGGSVASAGDVNGDGYADVIISAQGAGAYAGRAYVFLGSATGLGTTPATTLVGPDGAGAYYAFSVASAGDLNGDGFADIVIGAEGASGFTGRVHVYLGSASGVAPTPAVTWFGTDGPGGRFGWSVASAGDINGDGYADILVGANHFDQPSGSSVGPGRAYLYLGGAGGPAATPATTLTGLDGRGGQFGTSVSGAGDTDGDGYADVAIGALGPPGTPGFGYLFRGSAAGLATTPAPRIVGPGAVNNFGGSVAGAGDINGDGYSDLAVGDFCAPYVPSSDSCGAGAAYVFLGSASGLAVTPATTLSGPDGVGGSYGISVASASEIVAPAGHATREAAVERLRALGMTVDLSRHPTATGVHPSSRFAHSTKAKTAVLH